MVGIGRASDRPPAFPTEQHGCSWLLVPGLPVSLLQHIDHRLEDICRLIDVIAPLPEGLAGRGAICKTR